MPARGASRELRRESRRHAFYDRPKCSRRDFFGLERLTRSFHDTSNDLIDSDERRVGLGPDIDLPFSPIRTLESVPIPRCENRMTVDDYLAVFFLDRKKLVSGAFAQRFRRLVGLVAVRRLRRKRKCRDDCYAGLDARLTERREQPYLVDRIQSDSVSDVTQESFSGLNHAVALEV
jgi:hypothetical protein